MAMAPRLKCAQPLPKGRTAPLHVNKKGLGPLNEEHAKRGIAAFTDRFELRFTPG
jgi:hypothetical protein